MKSLLLFIVIVLVCRIGSRAQTFAQIDEKIAGFIERMDSIAQAPTGHIVDDSEILHPPIAVINDSLRAYIVEVASRVPATITAAFPVSVKERHLTLHNSPDNKLRVYTWETPRDYGAWGMRVTNVIQWKKGKGAVINGCSADDMVLAGEISGECNKIESITTKNNKTIYLVYDHAVGRPEYWQEAVTAFVIENDTLKDYPLFKTNKETINQISYNYDPQNSKDNRLHLSKDNSLFFVPVVIGDKVTGKYLTYKFDGDNFAFDKSAK